MTGPVLVLMDYQETICREDGAVGSGGLGAEVSRRNVLNAASATLDRFRRDGHHVVHVRVGFDEHYTNMTSAAKSFAAMRSGGMFLDSDPQSAICHEVAPRSDELVITKGCTNSFIGTHLSEKLLPMRPTELVMGGVATNHVVETTARYAVDSGYPVVVLEDLCASFNPEMHEFSISQILPRYLTVTTSGAYFA